jgi:hypothetical protein
MVLLQSFISMKSSNGLPTKFNGFSLDSDSFILVGGLPRPIGGVTTFLRRLFVHQSEAIDLFLDIYPGQKEQLPRDLKSKVRNLRGLGGLVWWWLFNGHKTRRKIVFFNFSQPRAFYLLWLLPKRANSSWHIMLHHGRLSTTSRVASFIFTRTLKKFDVVYSLSQQQSEFFNEFIASQTVLHKVKSYCSPIDFEPDLDALRRIAEIRRTFDKIIVMSGYPLEIYNFDLGIKKLLMAEKSNVCIAIFLYGPGPLRPYLHSQALNPRILIFEDKTETYFNTFLSKSNSLWRLNSIDSFGIVVADAVNYGLDVIATDVCERYPGAITVRLSEFMESSNPVASNHNRQEKEYQN